MFYKKGALKEISTFHFFSRKSALNRYQYFMKDVPGRHYMFEGVSDVVLVSLLLALNRFHTLLSCNDFWLWTSKCLLGWQTMTQELLVFWRRICCRLFTEFAKSLASIAHNQLLSCFSKILMNLLRDIKSVCEIIRKKMCFYRPVNTQYVLKLFKWWSGCHINILFTLNLLSVSTGIDN